jgi:hypothetical protein
MALKYDGYPRLAEIVLAVLKEQGPLKAKDIAHACRAHNAGHKPNVNAINKVLREYLAGMVTPVDGGGWAAQSADSN